MNRLYCGACILDMLQIASRYYFACYLVELHLKFFLFKLYQKGFLPPSWSRLWGNKWTICENRNLPGHFYFIYVFSAVKRLIASKIKVYVYIIYECVLIIFIMYCMYKYTHVYISEEYAMFIYQIYFLFLCDSVVEHCVSSAKGCGFDSKGTRTNENVYLNVIVSRFG